MPSIRYYNQTAPFWDWVASMENAAGEHPFFHAYASQGGEAREAPGSQGPPPQPETDGPPPPPEYEGSAPPPPPPQPNQTEGFPGAAPWGRHGGRCGGRGGWGGRGRHGAFPFGGPHPHRGGWGGFGGHGRHGHRGPFDMNALSQFLSQRFGFDVTDETEGNTKDKANNDKDFTPACDVFDTPEAYILHVSLPGAKKEDVGVNWDADKSEISVAGVVYRIGDEEMLKTLAMDEREVGVFERKVRLGSRANPAVVDSDAITAKMEDGVLVVRIPKTEEFVEIKKVDIE